MGTALANAEQHAPGASVVLSVRSQAVLPAVTVRDDGPGFDPAKTPPGFGISEILGRQLAGVGGTGLLQSCLGTGMSDLQIAKKRQLSERAIEDHKRKILEIFGIEMELATTASRGCPETSAYRRAQWQGRSHRGQRRPGQGIALFHRALYGIRPRHHA